MFPDKKQRSFTVEPFVMWALILTLAIGFKAVLILQNRIDFNADEAIVALMGRHILQGERPIFFYGQAYMGSLDAYLVALAFRLFGETVLSIRIVQVVLYLLTVILSVRIAQLFFSSRRAGWLTGLLLAVPTVNFSLYTTASLGGYGEALLLGSLSLLIGWKIRLSADKNERKESPYFWLFLFGLIAGLGFWANALSLVYSIPALIYASLGFRQQTLKTRIAAGLVVFFSACLGAFPWFVFAFSGGIGKLLHELTGGAVAVEGGSWFLMVYNHLLSLLLLGFTVILGWRPPWAVTWLALPLLIVDLAAWIFVFWKVRQEETAEIRKNYHYLAWVVITLTIGFLFTSFGVDPSGRYFLPVTQVLAIIAGGALRNSTAKPFSGWIAVGAIVIYQCIGTIQCVQTPVGITTQFYTPAQINMQAMPELIGFLEDQNITCGYSNYWVSYPLAFLTQEQVVFTPELPYHPDLRYTARDNRYAAYNQIVADCANPAYIVTNNAPLESALSAGLNKTGITWAYQEISDFHVYFNLSQKISPENLNLYAASAD